MSIQLKGTIAAALLAVSFSATAASSDAEVISDVEVKANNVTNSAIFFTSTPRHWIGQNKSFIATDFRIKTRNDNSVEIIHTDSNGDNWDFQFAAPNGEALKPAYYFNAKRYPFYRQFPGLSLSTTGRGCNKVEGDFNVLDVAYGDNNEITRLAVDFVHYCEARSETVFVRGGIRYNTDHVTIPVRWLPEQKQ